MEPDEPDGTDEGGERAAAELDEHGRPEPPVVADETTMLVAYLDYHRATFAWTCRDYSPPWSAVDWDSDPDWEWRTAADDSPEGLRALWADSVGRSRQRVTEALADGGLHRLAVRTWPDGRAPSLRWIVLHMIEEYARHNGHADLLRAAVDGETGE